MSSRHELVLTIEQGWLQVVIDTPAQPAHAAVVFCHGLTGDRCGPQRLLTLLAADLAQAGFLCVRFDFRGSGDASGSFAATTFASMRTDLEQIIGWTRHNYPTLDLALLGLSIGGVIPALVAPEQSHCRAVVLLSSDLIEDIRFDVAGEVAIRDGQFFLPESFFREREALWPRSDLLTAGIPVGLFYGEQDRKLAKAARELKRAGVKVQRINGVDHLFEQITARHALYDGVIAFLRQHLTVPKEYPLD